MDEPAAQTEPSQLSKRALRRLTQRAFVLAGRERVVRQAIREARLTTAWTIEDWGFSFTLFLNRGKLDFDRCPSRKNDATFIWHTAAGFFKDMETGQLATLEKSFPHEWRHAFELLFRIFSQELRKLFEDPVDENGDPLV